MVDLLGLRFREEGLQNGVQIFFQMRFPVVLSSFWSFCSGMKELREMSGGKQTDLDQVCDYDMIIADCW